MTSSPHAPYLADDVVSARVVVTENVALARDTYRIRIEHPEIARRIVPGQFLMMRIPGGDDPLLARPLALYDTVLDSAGQPIALDIVYLVVGKMTGRLTSFRHGDALEVLGPLGNGFLPASAGRLIMVAGGIGQTPFMALAREALGLRTYGAGTRNADRKSSVSLCYGARSAEYLAGVDDFAAMGVDVRLSTDDGSRGRHGLATELLAEELDGSSDEQVAIACCGPEPMMAAVAEIAAARGVACQVSLETPMACGIGVCFSCVAKVRDHSGEWDYRRTCVEGPIFDGANIVW